MDRINETQQAVLNFIREVISQRGVAPSVREIGEAVGLRSTSTVQYNLNALEKAGYIERDPNLKRTIRLAGGSSKATPVPLLGTVTAGVPILAQEQIEEYIPVALGKGGDYFQNGENSTISEFDDGVTFYSGGGGAGNKKGGTPNGADGAYITGGYPDPSYSHSAATPGIGGGGGGATYDGQIRADLPSSGGPGLVAIRFHF